jgi:hypothetical protein
VTGDVSGDVVKALPLSGSVHRENSYDLDFSEKAEEESLGNPGEYCYCGRPQLILYLIGSILLFVVYLLTFGFAFSGEFLFTA